MTTLNKKVIEPIYILFGARVRQLRDALDISQEELAKRVGLERTSISNIEIGRQRILLHDVEKFAKAFKIPERSLIKGIWL